MAKTKEEYMSDFKKWGLLGGRPKAFKSPKEMAEKLAEWLETAECRTRPVVKKDGVVINLESPAPVLIEGFCDFCGITKTTFYEYHAKPAFRPLTDFVRQKVEKYLAECCIEGPSGNKADFILKNAFGDAWQDKKVDELDLAKDLKQALVGFVPNGDKDGLSDLDTRVKPEYDNKDGLAQLDCRVAGASRNDNDGFVGGGDGTSKG